MVALVGDAEPEAEDGCGQDQEDDRSGAEPQPRAMLDRAAPAVGGGLSHGFGRPPRHFPAQGTDGEARQQRRGGEDGAGGGKWRDADPGSEYGDRPEAGSDQTAPAGDLDPFLGQAEQRRQEGEGADHREEDGDRRPQTHPGGTAGKNLEALDRRRVLHDLLSDLRGFGHVDVGREVHLGVGQLVGQRSLPGDLAPSLRRVRRHNGGAGVAGDPVLVGKPGVHPVEQLLHGCPDVGVVHALVGPEDDRSRLASDPELGKALVERREAVRAVGVGDVQHRVIGGAYGARRTEDSGQGQKPHAYGRDPMIEAPCADSPHVQTVTDPGWLAVGRRPGRG
jgi:hypothetical protein